MFRHIGVPSLIVALLLTTSFTRGFPSSPIHEASSLDSFKIKFDNITYDKNTTTCVAKVAFEIGGFFFTNYITHAFTIRKGAGDKLLYVSVSFFAALFVPYYGLLLACRSLETCANQKKNVLKRAGRGGGLCVVARTKNWRPRPGERAWCWRSTPNVDDRRFTSKLISYSGLDLEYISQDYVEVHGICRLPPGYMLARLPTNCRVHLDAPVPQTNQYPAAQDTASDSYPTTAPLSPSETPPKPVDKKKYSAISSNFNAIRPVTAFTQLITAGPLIYNSSMPARRAENGYAGYELTILPFLLMSILNTISSIATPDYGAAYMIRSSIMTEAEGRGGTFDGVFGALHESDNKVSLPELLNGHGKVIGEVGRCVVEGEIGCSTQCINTRMEFEGGDSIQCLGNCNSESESSPPCPFRYPSKGAWHRLEKGIYFVFRLQLWEGFRQEIPVLRWILSWADNANVRRDERISNPNNTIVNFARSRPQRLSITRLFKTLHHTYDHSLPVMLFPPIGNPEYRKGSTLEHYMFYITDIVFLLAMVAPYLITYLLTGYNSGHSSLFERVTILCWLLLMQMAAFPQRLVWNFVQTRLLPLPTRQFRWGLLVIISSGAIISAPALLGFFFVYQQLINSRRDECYGYFQDFAQTLGFTSFGG